MALNYTGFNCTESLAKSIEAIALEMARQGLFGTGDVTEAELALALTTKQNLNVVPGNLATNDPYTLQNTVREIRASAGGVTPLTIDAGMDSGGTWIIFAQGGSVTISKGAGVTFVPNELISTTSANQVIVAKNIGADTYLIQGHTPPTEARNLGDFDTLALAVAAFPHESLALWNAPVGSWITCKEYIAGGGYGGRVYRPWAAAQATCRWQGVLRAIDEMSETNAIVYPLQGSAPTATASSDAGASTTITHAGHGLPNRAGTDIYITGGTGWAVGRVAYTYIDANSYKLPVAYNANVPTIRTATNAGNPTTQKIITIPGGVLTKKGGFNLYNVWAFTDSSSNKYQKIDFGAAMNILNAVANVGATSLNDERILRNRNNSLAQQKCQANVSNSAFSRNSGVPTLGTENTANNTDIKLYSDLPVGGIFQSLEHVKLELVL